jgi:hypothetical protein
VFRKLLDEEFHSDSLDIFGDGIGRAEELVAKARKNALRHSFVAVYSLELNSSLLFDRESVEIEAERLRTTIDMLKHMRDLQRQLTSHAAEGRSGEQPAQLSPLRLPDPDLPVPPLFERLAILTSLEQLTPESREAGLRYLEESAADSADLVTAQAASSMESILEAVRTRTSARTPALRDP